MAATVEEGNERGWGEDVCPLRKGITCDVDAESGSGNAGG